MAWPTASRHQRGYGSDWDRTRERILKRDKRLCKCEECTRLHRIRKATEVNHIIPKAKCEAMGWTKKQTDADSNLQAVHSDCHTRITLEQQGKTPKDRRVIGLDGYPIDDTTGQPPGGIKL